MYDFKKMLQEVKNTESINERYTDKELSQINVAADTVNVKVSDYDGNSTKNLGLNDMESLKAMEKFIKARIKAIK